MSKSKGPASGIDSQLEAAAGKLPYRRPALTLHGSVRELTGSGSGGSADSTMPML